MHKSPLLLVLAFVASSQAAFGDIVNYKPILNSPSKIYHGSINYNRALPENMTGSAQQVIVEGAALYTFDYGIDEVNRLAKEGVLIGNESEDNYISLKQGNVLLNPSRDIVIGTSAGKISADAGASTFIMLSGSGLIVYDLSGQVTVSANAKTIVLEAGQMLVIASEATKEFDKLNLNCHAVAYSNAQLLDWRSNIATAFLANFSVCSALNTIEPLKRLTVSHNKRDRSVLAMLTNNAIPTTNIILDKSAANNAGNNSFKIANGGL